MFPVSSITSCCQRSVGPRTDRVEYYDCMAINFIIQLNHILLWSTGTPGWMGRIPRREGRGDPLSADAQQQLRQSYGGGGRWQRWLRRQHQDLPAEGCKARRAGPQVGHAKTPLRPAKVTPASADDEWLKTLPRSWEFCTCVWLRWLVEHETFESFSMFNAGRRARVSVLEVLLRVALTYFNYSSYQLMVLNNTSLFHVIVLMQMYFGPFQSWDATVGPFDNFIKDTDVVRGSVISHANSPSIVDGKLHTFASGNVLHAR